MSSVYGLITLFRAAKTADMPAAGAAAPAAEGAAGPFCSRLPGPPGGGGGGAGGPGLEGLAPAVIYCQSGITAGKAQSL